MKIFKLFLGIVILVGLLLASFGPTKTSYASNKDQVTDPTATPTATATVVTETVVVTVPPAPSETPAPSAGERPVIILSYYKSGEAVPGGEFKVDLTFKNTGQHYAYNLIITFQSEGFIPTGSGGMQSISEIAPGNSASISQGFIASPVTQFAQNPTITVNVGYTDVNGVAFNNAFIVPVVMKPLSGGSAQPTVTPTPIPRPRLIIASYTTDLPKLEAGNSFTLEINVQNMGNVDAKNITMVLGGGTTTTTGGTPTGVSGSGANLSVFAPMGTSNLYYMGDLASGAAKVQAMDLVVNVGTNPGVYPLNISFSYNDPSGAVIVDEQVITLLVYNLPNLSASFYQPTGDFYAGQPGLLPIQITNLDTRSIVLGEMEISSTNGTITNNLVTIGTIDPGGYFTVDAEYWPEQPGEATITLLINYTDDFTNASTVELTLPPVNVVESMPFPPDDGSGGEVIPEPLPEPSLSWWQILLGFLGLTGG